MNKSNKENSTVLAREYSHGNSNTKKCSKEHILIKVWINKENGIDTLEELMKNVTEVEAEVLIKELVGEGELTIEGIKILFTEKGSAYAENLIRRHRLAEVMLTELLAMDDHSAHTQACEFEHILTTEVADSICTFLGHPLQCPHDMQIPRGECCTTFQKKIRPLIRPLIDLKIGESGKIVFMTPKSHLSLDRLMTFGITPGSTIKLHQKRPSLVLQIDETDLALDYDIAKNIFVKQVNGEIWSK